MESKELKLLRILERRESIEENDQKHLAILEQGYRGECEFDNKVYSKLSERGTILNDLLFEYNGTTFQIDSLLITSSAIYLFEIKNFEGDYSIRDELWFYGTNSEIRNPLLQLRRSESLLRQLLTKHKVNIPVESYLVFINPNFFLYNAPTDLPAIFSSQLDRFLIKLANTIPKSTPRQHKITEILLSQHIKDFPLKRMPVYNLDSLHKGIPCFKCSGWMKPSDRSNLICDKCDKTEKIDHAVLRSIDEFQFLFPSHKITTNIIFEWCEVIQSKRVIRRILGQHLIRMNNKRDAYYVRQ